MCFAVVVGKKASVDGSVLFGHSEQNCGANLIHYRRIPRRRHAQGATMRLCGGALLPLPLETWSFLWTEAPGLEFSDNCFNEWGVAVACNGCPTKEDTLPVVAKRGDISEGGLGHLLPRLVAMHARTAREGVELAARWVERFGYTGIGRTMTVADPHEAWVMSLVRGRQYLAVRVPDEMVVVIPNRHVIGEVTDLHDRANVIASAGLIDYAISRGWYDPASGPFNFQMAYAATPQGSMEAEYGVCSRQWHGQALVRGVEPSFPPTGLLPFAVRPAHRYGVQDVATILRSHLEATAFDLESAHASGSPHELENDIDASYARCACNIATQESAIWQLRSWLPREVGCLVWRATGVPCTSVYTPWYSATDQIPAAFHDGADSETAMDLAHHFQPEAALFQPSEGSVFWTWQRLCARVDTDYRLTAPLVKARWQELEQVAFALQPTVEETALQLWRESPDLGRRLLSDYSVGRALQAWQQARELLRSLEAWR